MNRLISFFCAILSLLSFIELNAQNSGMLTGSVVDGNGEPISQATIALVGTPSGTYSNENGAFKIEGISEGIYSVHIGSVGYRSETRSVEISSGTPVLVNVTLFEDMLNLEEAVVSGTRYELDRKNAPIVVQVLDAQILESTQSISISEGLSYQPGVRVETNCQNCGFTQVRMNGLQGGYSQILLNSRPIFSALNGVYGLEQIPSNIVERIEVVRSGGSALYGSNAIAGTINIITKDPVENLWEMRSNSALVANEVLDQTFNFSGSIVEKSGKHGITLYGMNRNRDSYDANGDGFTELVELTNNVLGAKAFYRPGELSKITVDFSALNEYRRGGDRLDLAPHFTDITEELTHQTVFGGITLDKWSRNEKNKFSIYTSGQRTDRDSFYGGLGGGRTAQDSLLAISAYGTTFDVSWVTGAVFNRNLRKNDVFTLGIENQFYSTQDEITGYRRAIDQTVNTLGVFGQYEWKPSERLTTLFGLRFDQSQVDGSYQVQQLSTSSNADLSILSPRVTLLYKISELLRFRGGYARGFRAPQAFNEDLHISSVGGEPQFVILSNNLNKETSDAYTASFNFTKESGRVQSNLLVEGFYTQLYDPFTIVSTGAVLANGSIVEEVQNGSRALVSGLNFEAGYSPSHKLSFQLGGTIQQTSYSESQVLFEPETDSEEIIQVDEFVRTPNAYGYFTSFVKILPDLKLDVSGTYTGNMIVPRVIDASGALSLVETDPFYDVNIKARYDMDLKDGFHLGLSAGVKNVFNSFQRDFDRGPTRDSDFVYGPAAPRSIFVSISLGNL